MSLRPCFLRLTLNLALIIQRLSIFFFQFYITRKMFSHPSLQNIFAYPWVYTYHRLKTTGTLTQYRDGLPKYPEGVKLQTPARSNVHPLSASVERVEGEYDYDYSAAIPPQPHFPRHYNAICAIVYLHASSLLLPWQYTHIKKRGT
jgi:hypothetical protein